MTLPDVPKKTFESISMLKSSDDKIRDEVLTRMLKTPHKPYVAKKRAINKKSKKA